MFCGLMSRWISPASCAESSASAIGRRIRSVRAPSSSRAMIISFRFGPRTSRIAMNSESSHSPASKIVTMCGWSSAAWIRPSWRKRSLNDGSIPSVPARIFSATVRPSESWRAS